MKLDLRNPKHKILARKFIINQFNKIAKKKKGKISIIDLWNTEFKLEKKYNLNSRQSQKLTSNVLNFIAFK
tara:strand:+ start:511 stop:723 length:213 start_codon:yes stop_codon:yes gene_type:complete